MEDEDEDDTPFDQPEDKRKAMRARTDRRLGGGMLKWEREMMDEDPFAFTKPEYLMERFSRDASEDIGYYDRILRDRENQIASGSSRFGNTEEDEYYDPGEPEPLFSQSEIADSQRVYDQIQSEPEYIDDQEDIETMLRNEEENRRQDWRVRPRPGPPRSDPVFNPQNVLDLAPGGHSPQMRGY